MNVRLSRRTAQLRLVLVERQSKAIQPLVQLTQERLRIVFSLKAQYRVIGVPHDDNIARGLPLAPLVEKKECLSMHHHQ